MISTPISPTAVASQRRTPTFSPRKTIDSAVTNSGETKPVAEASAIGRNRRPEMKNSDEPAARRRASHCRPGAVDLQRKQRRARHHRRRHDQREHQEADPGDLDRGQRRRQIFRGDVGGAEKHRRGEDQRDAVERPVGARRRAGRSDAQRRVVSLATTAGFFSGNGNVRCPALRLRRVAESRQSRKQKFSNRARPKERQLAGPARSENRTPICAIARGGPPDKTAPLKHVC